MKNWLKYGLIGAGIPLGLGLASFFIFSIFSSLLPSGTAGVAVVFAIIGWAILLIVPGFIVGALIGLKKDKLQTN